MYAGSNPVGDTNLMSMSSSGLGLLFFKQSNVGSNPIIDAKYVGLAKRPGSGLQTRLDAFDSRNLLQNTVDCSLI